MKALVFGEILWDIIDDVPHLGGAPLNFAAHLVKSGAESHIISALGNDELGQRALDQVGQTGVQTKSIQSNEHPTGTVDVFLDNGQPDYLIHTDVAYDHIISTDQSYKGTGIDLFYFGTLIQRSEQSRDTLYKLLDFNIFEFVFYDVNLRKDCFNKANIERSLRYANIIKLNKEEVEAIGELVFGELMDMETFLQALSKKYNPKIVIVTDGGNGCFIYENKALKHVHGLSVTVKDAVGAGDAFSAAFMAKYFKCRDALLSATVANKVGAYVASNQGAIPEYSEELLSALK